jgi:uncharacterized protein
MLIEMVVESVRVNLQNYQRVVVLKEKESDRYLPIWIGNNEADAIVMQMQSVQVPRPQTHDLLRSVINELGAKVTRIVVTDLAEDVFYARISIDLDGKHVEVDSRPSDAIALAVRAQAPIFAEDTVLDKAGVAMDGDRGDQSDTEKQGGPREGTKADEEKLSPFRDFINTLDLDDLGKSEK